MQLVWFKIICTKAYTWEQLNMENVTEKSLSLSSSGTPVTIFLTWFSLNPCRSHLYWFYKELLQWRQGCLHHVKCWPFRHHAAYHCRDIKDVTCQWEGQVLLSSNKVTCLIFNYFFNGLCKKSPTVLGLP